MGQRMARQADERRDRETAEFEARIEQLEDEVKQLHQKQFDDISSPKRLAVYIGQLRADSLARLTEDCRKACASMIEENPHVQWRLMHAAYDPVSKL